MRPQPVNVHFADQEVGRAGARSRSRSRGGKARCKEQVKMKEVTASQRKAESDSKLALEKEKLAWLREQCHESERLTEVLTVCTKFAQLIITILKC